MTNKELEDVHFKVESQYMMLCMTFDLGLDNENDYKNFGCLNTSSFFIFNNL